MGLISKLSKKLKRVVECKADGFIMEHDNDKFKVLVEYKPMKPQTTATQTQAEIPTPTHSKPDESISVNSGSQLLSKWDNFITHKKHEYETYSFSLKFKDESIAVLNTMEHRIMNPDEFPQDTLSYQFIQDVNSMDEMAIHDFLALVWVNE